jgi:gamma-glutamyltranspeptidase / glutathione hydrolase
MPANRSIVAALMLLVLALAGCSKSTQTPRDMVATANPLASAAAVEMLKEGGNAVDAAVAAQLVLGLVEPQSLGLGGGAFLMFFDARRKRVHAIDGREKAPLQAGENLFLGPDGQPFKRGWVEIGGRSVGVPGTVALMFEAHRRHGRLPWRDLFTPAIRLAEQGFVVSPRLAAAIADAPRLTEDPMARQLFFQQAAPEGPLVPLPAGATLKNPAYAFTLRRIALDGPAAFYAGEVAAQIVSRVRGHPSNPGLMTAWDLAAYRAPEREAVCRTYRGYRICGMPPPSSGGLTALMILRMLEPYRMKDLTSNGPMAAHLIAETSRLAFADRDRYMADGDFVEVPSAPLLSRAYLDGRARTIDPGRDMGEAAPGAPMAEHVVEAGDSGRAEAGTSHLAIVDRRGNAVSMTMTIEQSFGAHIMAAGFMLNNELTDFALKPERDGLKVVNRVEPGKRPRSSMAPMLVFGPDGALFAAVGSPGGSRIIGYVAQTLVALIDWRMTMQQAVALPHILNRNGETELERGTQAEQLAPALAAMGHQVDITELESGLQGIRIVDKRMDGGVDPRREGAVMTSAR